MISRIEINKWQFIGLMVLVTAAIPIGITAFELMTSDKESVIFLEHYHPVIGMLILSYYVLLLALGIAWLVKQLMSFIKLKNETVKNELQHLQSQVNPHFFFNVLNNLYGLVGKDAKKAQQLILKLSDLMRYSIYDGQKEVVTIAEITIREKISDLLLILNQEDLIQVHKSFAVTKKYIKSIESNRIFIDDYIIPIGKTYRLNVTQLLK